MVQNSSLNVATNSYNTCQELIVKHHSNPLSPHKEQKGDLSHVQKKKNLQWIIILTLNIFCAGIGNRDANSGGSVCAGRLSVL